MVCSRHGCHQGDKGTRDGIFVLAGSRHGPEGRFHHPKRFSSVVCLSWERSRGLTCLHPKMKASTAGSCAVLHTTKELRITRTGDLACGMPSTILLSRPMLGHVAQHDLWREKCSSVIESMDVKAVEYTLQYLMFSLQHVTSMRWQHANEFHECQARRACRKTFPAKGGCRRVSSLCAGKCAYRRAYKWTIELPKAHCSDLVSNTPWQEPMKIAKLTDEEMNLEPLVLWEPNEPIAPVPEPAVVAQAEGENAPAAPTKAEVCTMFMCDDISTSKHLVCYNNGVVQEC